MPPFKKKYYSMLWFDLIVSEPGGKQNCKVSDESET